MQKICINPWCKQPFEFLDEDNEMMKKFDVEMELEECSECRHDHRRLFGPRFKLHRRKSDLSGEPILSIFHPRHTFPVYSIQEWWSDKWDPLSYGREFDFGKLFFPQFESLYNAVPRIANQNENTENAEYSYSTANSKNVYYCRTVHRSENVYYSQYITGYNQTICDCLVTQKSSFLYECVYCFNCSGSTYLYKCYDSGDCHFSIDLVGCTDCLFCNNLRNKSFHVDNKPVSKEEYQKIKEKVRSGKYSDLVESMQHFGEVYARTLWKNLSNTNSENCVGDVLNNCSNCFECFNCVNTHDSRYCTRLTPSEKCVSAMDVSSGGIGELIYNCMGLGGGNYFMRMCLTCRQCSDLVYCADCHSTKDCFGCVGLKHMRYCILNKQYSKEDYEELVPKVIAHMRSTEEWGEYFPLTLSAFAYNESNAMDEHILSKAEVLKRGWQWIEGKELPPEGIPTKEWPEDIAKVPNTIMQNVFICVTSKKPFKIVPQELEFYRTMNVPIPREHPDIRMARRRSLMTPYRLFDRACAKCGKTMKTSYPPERKELVVCETCYRKEVY